MTTSFKKWFFAELALGSDGMRDNQATQTAQATAQVAQNWLGQNANADAQSQLISGSMNRSALGNKLMSAGTNAVQMAPNTLAAKTTAPAVAGFLQNQLKLPNIIKSPIGVKAMRKYMGKK